MEKPVQWMTLQELRDERDRTSPDWEAMDLDGVHAIGQLPALANGCAPSPVVADDLLRRPCLGDAP